MFSAAVYIQFVYFSGALPVGNQYFGEAILETVIGSVNCIGSELQLLDCSYSSEPTGDTGRSDAGVVCQGVLHPSFKMRMVHCMGCGRCA